MAVSGRKILDFQRSISQGSAEDVEQSCDSCLAGNQHVEAQGFCVDCHEYLCTHCLTYHKRTKASRHHKLLNKDEMVKHAASAKPAEVCTEKCSIHRNEIIKFFCPGHGEIGCNDCMIMNHRTCDLDYIPDKCEGIGDSQEYIETVQQVEEKLKQVSILEKKAESKDQKIDCTCDKVNQEFFSFRKEINDHLDLLQNTIATKASKMKSTSKLQVQSVIDSCTNYTSDLKQLHSSMQQNKAGGQNGQLFIGIKQAQSRLQSMEVEHIESALDQIKTQITFKRNSDLKHVFSLDNFGMLVELSTPPTLQTTGNTTTPSGSDTITQHGGSVQYRTSQVKTKETKMFSSLTNTASINVRTQSDKHCCGITGIAALSSNKIMLADSENKSLKLVDIQKQAVVEEKHLDSKPWDIAVLPQDQVAVTLPDKKQIQIIITAVKLSTDRCIQVKGHCRGVTYHQDCLYVLCWDPPKVCVLDMKGNVQNTISLSDTAIFSSPNYIALSHDQKLLYSSNCGNNSVVSVTLQGEVSAVYKHKGLDGPLGMLLLDDGALLVCCCDNTLHHISADLTQGKKVLDGIMYPRSICHSADRSQIYVGCFNVQLKVCDILYSP